MLADHKIALVQRVIDEVWNAGDVDLADELFGSTYVNHGGLIPDLVVGPEIIKLTVSLYRTAFPRLRLTVEDLRVDRDQVILQWTARSGTVAEDEEGKVAGTTCCRLASGQIAESWTSWDLAD